MQHDRTLSRIVSADVFKTKSLWQVEVALNRAQLPLTTNRIAHIYVDLWSIKRRITWRHGVLQPVTIQRFHEGISCLLPNLV